jgi:SAM-dependent methyltransferase
MHLDVLDLRNFYYRTRLGRTAQRALRAQVAAIWPSRSEGTVVGFGFAVPLLRPLMDGADRVIALMPGQQGVMPWPPGMANVSVLCDETDWPLPGGIADRMIMLHGLETSENPAAVLDEAWRVLAPGGRLLVLVPNRGGLWARRDRTPFGFGQPYTAGQLEAQLRRHGFTPERSASALFVPPSDAPFWRRSANLWETAGRRVMPWLAGGVLLVDATKLVEAPTQRGHGARLRRPLRVLEGVGQPVPEPG